MKNRGRSGDYGYPFVANEPLHFFLGSVPLWLCAQPLFHSPYTLPSSVSCKPSLPSLPRSFLASSPFNRLRVARWTDGRMQAIISGQHYWQGSQLHQRRGNEHFSKRTEPAGVVWLRIHGDAAVDRGAVRRGDCRAGGAGLLWIYDRDAHDRRPGG